MIKIQEKKTTTSYVFHKLVVGEHQKLVKGVVDAEIGRLLVAHFFFK